MRAFYIAGVVATLAIAAVSVWSTHAQTQRAETPQPAAVRQDCSIPEDWGQFRGTAQIPLNQTFETFWPALIFEDKNGKLTFFDPLDCLRRAGLNSKGVAELHRTK